ncbi:ATPase AAA [Sulfurimicrobium lacus]|uniref:ATPase AAA n=1 Tax=Sulfurimicrobium lacus TaxID=2715678 RepID=A0A6F8VCC1_9PROT|nr:ExeA family protein [Sulfurimicrobium lacus]BCB26757.1 ATPase AAA [Sulfurimicrobium lacus]
MYLSYFALTEAPFSIAPDPRYLYMSQRHQEALAHLLYGVNGEGGFVLLTGEVGTGKTTICRCLLEQIPEACVVAYIFNPRLTVAELLSTICVEFGIDFPPGNTSLKLFVDLITRFLLDAHAQGKRAVLIIDEAQNLSTDVLEQMRLLTNLETSQRKLLQIILLGQPELSDMLGRSELRQLAQRIVARYHLEVLNREEVAAYVQHRLEVSGVYRQLFSTSLMKIVHRLTGGVPRVINVLCDRALLGTYVQGKDRVDRSTLMRAARETLPPSTPAYRRRAFQLSAGLLLLASAAWGAQWYQQQNLPDSGRAPLQARDSLEKPMSASVRGVAPRNEERGIVTRPVADSLEWTASAPRANSRDMAFSALFLAWNMDFPGTDACRRVESAGLYCRSSRGGLEELRQLNRPAVLQLQDEAGREFYATLMRLDADKATFSLGDQTREVWLGALAAHWSGYYTVLWREPPSGYKNIRPGDRGAAVEWLSRLLAQARGKTEGASGHRVFDVGLTRQVKQFQLAHGLMPDGMAGPQTLTHLIAAADQQAPRLLAQPGDK